MTAREDAFRLVTGEPGLAVLSGPAGEDRRLVLHGNDWIVEGPAGRCRLRRAEDAETIVLIEDSGREAGRLAPLLGRDDPWPADALLADGRVFRVSLVAGREPRIELRSWETRGAYLAARASDDGWSIEITPAGRRLGGLEQLVLLLCAALLGPGPA